MPLPQDTDGDHWRELDRAALARAYSPSSCVGGDYRPYVQAYSNRSDEVRSVWSCRELAYGGEPTQRIDLFMPVGVGAQAMGPPSLLVYIHGGYWQELSRRDSVFAAPGCLHQGVAFAAIGYTLAPHASVSDIVGECRRALCWLMQHVQALGFDGLRVVLAGSSAGAHLAAMVALPGWRGVAADLPYPIRVLVLMSGIYELAPIVETPINDALGLTAHDAHENSPLCQALHDFPASIVCWGQNETGEFKRQSRRFVGALRLAERPVRAFELPGRHHFDLVFDLTDPVTHLGRQVLECLLKGSPLA